ncbi:MAG: tRNA 2-thiouridine(34) synthase MnmA [Candidatus Moranbacteria bacterium]|nr:tRNA 2-thiouridine(34) synthase MnmA [Candidatus Moranbacteria bacterium]
MDKSYKKQVIVAISPKESLRDPTGQAGGHSKKVIIAMSGGIDSSVAAYLLKKQGYDVTGFHLRLFKDEKKEKQIKKIAKMIGIPLVVRDARKEFKKKVIDYFLREYETGRTPNPCVACNREIKFKFLFDELSKQNADYVATGHYARIMKHITYNIKHGIYKLYKAKDKTKDQSYFLYTLAQKQLVKIIFPLGNYTKTEVRKLAKKFRSPVTQKDESQNVCFLAGKCPDDFLKRYLKLRKGNIVDSRGKIIGRHEGLPFYTIGQRRGIKIGGTGPYYVVGKNKKQNRLIVTNKKDDPLIFRKSAFLQNVNWIAGKPASTRSHRGEPKLPLKVLARTRYRNPLVGAIIELTNNRPARFDSRSDSGRQLITKNFKCKVVFEKPQRAVTPGQSAVFYGKNGEVLGGGVIS